MMNAGKEEKKANFSRCAFLGNSVIPDVVRFAFLYLWTGSRDVDVLQRTSWDFSLPTPVGPKENPAHGTLVDGQMMALAPPVLPELSPDRRVLLDPGAYDYPSSRRQVHTLPKLTKPLYITTWATPRHGNVSPSRILTRRTRIDLPTQLRYAATTPDDVRGGIPNPQFLEWLMGFPLDWTRTQTS
jgi:hypothetical protein